MTQSLHGKVVAALVTDGFEQVELTGPKKALEDAGATVRILSDKAGEVRGWNHHQPAEAFRVDGTFEDASLDDYDALLLPGGVDIDPVHFGVVMTANLSIGCFTPPFGVNIFIAQAVFKEPVGIIYRGVMPFIWLSIAVLMLITYVPLLSIGILKWTG